MGQMENHAPPSAIIIDCGEREIERMVRKFRFELDGMEFSGFAVTGSQSDDYVEWDETGDADFDFSKGSSIRTQIEEQLLTEIWLMTGI